MSCIDYSQKSSERRRSNSTSMCPMPSIPEYPGFQDLKGTKSLPGRLHSSPALITSSKGNSTSHNTVAIHSLVQWSLQFQGIAGLAGDHTLLSSSKSTGQFHDKSLQDYFNERLLELKHRHIQVPRPSN